MEYSTALASEDDTSGRRGLEIHGRVCEGDGDGDGTGNAVGLGSRSGVGMGNAVGLGSRSGVDMGIGIGSDSGIGNGSSRSTRIKDNCRDGGSGGGDSNLRQCCGEAMS